MKPFAKSLILSSLSFSLFAAPNPVNSKNQMQDPNPSARFGTFRKSNFFLTGEALWLKPLTQENAKYVIEESAQTENRTYKRFQNDFQVGVRAAIGYNTSYDGWDLVLSYVGFNYDHSNAYLYQNLVQSVNDQGRINYEYHLNWGDLDLGRMFKISKRLKMRPHAGIRSIWLSQEAKVHYTNIYQSTGNYVKDKYQGTLVGIEAGIDSLWMLSQEFSIYANFAASLLADSQNATKKAFNAATSVSSNYRFNYNSRIVNNFDLMLGLRWDKNFSKDKYHLGINLGYEQHSFININSIDVIWQTAAKASETSLLTDTDFTLQGIALGARFDF